MIVTSDFLTCQGKMASEDVIIFIVKLEHLYQCPLICDVSREDGQ